MPPRKKPQQLDLVDQVNALPPSVEEAMRPSGRVHADNPNFEKTDNDLIAENHKLEDQLKAGLAKYNEWAKPYKARVDEIENEIQRRLLERGADSTKTEAGTAYISNIMNQKVENIPALFDYLADNWDEIGGEAKISVPVGVVRAHMEKNEGRPPPGISISYYARLNINRS